MIKRRIAAVLICVFACLQLAGCKKSDELQNGYYTAELSEYSHGWKEYVTICVMENEIVSVEFNAKNASGFIKAWDMAYMRAMNAVQGTYPNRYTRTYAAELLAGQSPDGIDMVTGATTSGGNFVELASAAIEQAKKGDSSIAVVEAAE